MPNSLCKTFCINETTIEPLLTHVKQETVHHNPLATKSKITELYMSHISEPIAESIDFATILCHQYRQSIDYEVKLN